MALFESKKNTKGPKEAKKEVALVKEPKKNSNMNMGASILLSHRITEKASMKAGEGIYTFNVAERATKHSVAKAVEQMYKVIPLRVNMASVPAKKVFVRGKVGMKKGGKKAYVYLKAGDKIEFV